MTTVTSYRKLPTILPTVQPTTTVCIDKRPDCKLLAPSKQQIMYFDRISPIRSVFSKTSVTFYFSLATVTLTNYNFCPKNK